MGVESAEMIQVPGGKNVGKAKYTETTCPPSEGRLLYCSCVDLSENVIEPHGKRGELASALWISPFWSYRFQLI